MYQAVKVLHDLGIHQINGLFTSEKRIILKENSTSIVDWNGFMGWYLRITFMVFCHWCVKKDCKSVFPEIVKTLKK